jgi:hypothetical protein
MDYSMWFYLVPEALLLGILGTLVFVAGRSSACPRGDSLLAES